MPPPPNNNFADRIPLSGLSITATGYTAKASTEAGEPWGGPFTIWYSWTAPANGFVVFGTVGSEPDAWGQVYTGTALSSLTRVNWSAYPGQNYNGFPIYATAGTTYQIQVSGWSPGAVALQISYPPILIVTSPFDGTSFPAPTDITISALSVDLDGSIRRMECSGDGHWLRAVAGDTLSTVWSNVASGTHWIWIEVTATDNLGVETTVYLTVTVRGL